MRKIIFLILIVQTLFCFSQVSKKDLKEKEGILSYVDSSYIPDFRYESNWFTYGVSYEIVNSTFGISLSNGLKERPLIHFEDFNDSFQYFTNFQTNFQKDYSITIELGIDYPFRYLPISYASLEFVQRNVEENNSFQRDINFTNKIYLGFLKLNSYFLLKAGMQTLNNEDNFGISLGLQKSYKFNPTNLISGLYFGFLVGHYNKYQNYSAFFHSFLFKEKMSFRISYDKINRYNFLNVGINFVFYNLKETIIHENN